MTDGPLPGIKETRALLAALSDYFLSGTDEISHEITTKNGWILKVTAEVIQRPKEEEQ